MKTKKPLYDPVEYLQAITETREAIFLADIKGDRDLRNTFNIISANLLNFFPHMPFEKHEYFSRTVKWHQAWAALDQNYTHLFETTKIADNNGILPRAKAGERFIFCTFHLGSYRLLNPFLAFRNIPFSLVTDTNFIETQGEESHALFERMHGAVRKREETPIPVEILDAEKSKIILQAARKINSGSSLVFYIDGNTGVGGILHDKTKSVPVNFFKKPIYARKGISFISHFTKTPIVPVISFRTGWLERELHFLDPIIPAADNREQFCEDATAQLYRTFEEYVSAYPEQWEGWFYINKFMDGALPAHNKPRQQQETGAPASSGTYRLNERNFGLMDYSHGKFILHKKTLQLSEIDNSFFTILEFFSEARSFSEVRDSFGINESEFNELVSLELIIRNNDQAN